MQLLMTAHLGVTPTCAEARAGYPVKAGASVQHKQTPNTQKGLQHVAIKAQVDK